VPQLSLTNQDTGERIMVLPKQPTHWMTCNEDDWEKIEFYMMNLVEDWWNPEEGEYPLINPHEAFLQRAEELGIQVVVCDWVS